MATFTFTNSILPSTPGVYIIVDSQNQAIYIGQTHDLEDRIADYRRDFTHCMHGYGPARILFEQIAGQADRLAREAQLIAQYQPPCNG